MKITLHPSPTKTDVLIIPLYKGEKISSKVKKMLGSKATKMVELRMKAKDFEGEEKQTLTLFPESKETKRIVLVGRGNKKEQLPNATKVLGGTLAGIAKAAKAKDAAIVVDEKDLREVASGFVLGSYEFTKYKKSDKKSPKLAKVQFITESNKNTKSIIKEIEVFKDSSAIVRDLVNQTASDLNPQGFVTEARKVAKKFKMKIQVMDEKKLKSLGCGGILGVGRGAEVQPRMIILEYKHKTSAKNPDIAFVGKGITFDSGGLNLKPTNYIETMKQDMAGAGTVLGTMHAIAQAKLPGYFVGVLVCAENAVSDRSTHPGDVLKMYNGKTVEVTNTDAEGRLVLADGLAYTEKTYKPKTMLNIATLTGAVSVALGYNITGVMGNNEKLITKIMKAAKDTEERMWELPLDEDFVKATKGTFTDLKNSTNGVRAGSSMGGAFLKNFVDKTQWAHFDIGGTAWAEKPTPNTAYGATAACLKTFFELAKRI